MNMNSNSYYIGIDFGTLSARGVLVSAEDGSIYADEVFVYPHGVITGSLPSGVPLPSAYALADAADYREALCTCIKNLVSKAKIHPESVIAIGIDATTYTMVPCLATGTVLCELQEYADNPKAYIKLWKDHSAVAQAEKISAVHAETGGFPAINHYGGSVNCEWALPKLLETYEESPELFAAVDRFCDLGEWLTWQLIGKPINSLYSAGFKVMYTPETGWPDKDALEKLAPGFSEAFYGKVAGPISDYSAPAGFLTGSAAESLGLCAGIPVAVPMGDGSMPGVFFCTKDHNAIAITLGTSVAMAFVSDCLVPASGINGVVKDGIVPGYYSYDAGQPCAGDMLNWFVENQVTSEYYKKAQSLDMGIHGYLSSLSVGSQPYLNKLTVLDWFNGNRGILNDLSLRGGILGLSLETKAEDIYCAMIQGIACGTRVILEHLAQNGLKYDKVIICGGIAEKNDFVRKEYANILGCDIYISTLKNITATSAAVLAAVAAGSKPEEAAERLCCSDFVTIKPDLVHRSEYEAIYRRYKKYYNLLSIS